MTVGSPKPHPVEVELKYRAATRAVGERFLEAAALGPLPAIGSSATIPFEDRYVDTPDGALARSGYAARLRTTPAGTVVSLKSTVPGGSDGIHRRRELEGAADPTALPRSWPPSDARAELLELSDGVALDERVTVRQVRRKRLFGHERTTVEVSVDEVEAVAAGVVVGRWIELEVELVRGTEADLAPVAALLDADPELTPTAQSKLEAAIAAASAGKRDGSDGAAVQPSPGRYPDVSADDTLAQAGRKVLRFHLERMVDREAGTRAGSVTDLHKMRVATRRMRAAWRVFGEAYPERATRPLRQNLRRVARRLGAVRDRDVLIEALEAWRDSRPPREQGGLEALAGAWAAEREDGRVRLLRELERARYRRLVGDLRAFVAFDGAEVAGPATSPTRCVGDTGPARIWAAHGELRSYGPVLGAADVAALHELRIAAKWLRYTLEFLARPLDAGLDALVEPVVALQDHLGALHDADVAGGLARAFLADRDSSLDAPAVAAIEAFVASRDAEVARLRASVAEPWHAVAGPGYRRRLGRAVARL